jgi:alpha/beta hydrolase fold
MRSLWGAAPAGAALPVRPSPFQVDFDDDVIAQIRARLRSATLPAARGQGWEHGASIDYRERMARIRPRVPARDRRPRPPDTARGEIADSFDVVIPSLPGFGLSGRPEGVVGPQSTARLWRRLMTEVLGYERFGAQGGDLGSMVTAYLGGEHADVVSAIHLNLVPIRPVPETVLSPRNAAGRRTRTPTARVSWTTSHCSSTHFACLEQPELFVCDVRQFFRAHLAGTQSAGHALPWGHLQLLRRQTYGG